MYGLSIASPVPRRTGLALALLLPLLSPLSNSVHAQQSTGVVRGTITEAGTGRPLSGAQVSIKGTQRGNIADASGAYQITAVTPGAAVVRVDLIGFRSAEQAVTVVAGQTATVNVQLNQSAIGLDAIVVTGTSGRGQAKRTLGNSVSTVNADKITETAPIQNVQQLIQGRTPGVTMMNSTGVIGGGSRTRIRGSGSLNAGNEPVVFVDGVRVQSGQSQTSGNTAQPINLLEAFNPQDIESIEVIKGPAAATLYGAEAATGVIQIITKKGRPAAGLQWSFNQEYGEADWSRSHIKTYWLCTDARMANLAVNPGCGAFNASQPLEERLLIDYPLDPKRRSAGVKHQYKMRADSFRAAGNTARADAWANQDYPCVFPQQAPCQPNPLRTGVLRNTNLSVRGGGENYNFYLSGEKNDEDGTFNNNFNNRVGGRANFGFVPSPKSNFNVNVGYTQLDQQTPLSDNASNSVVRNSYRGEAGGLRGQYLPGFKNYMPEFSNKYARHLEQERLTLGMTGSYNPFSWWTNKLTFGLDSRETNRLDGNNIDQTGGILYSGNNAGGSIDIATTKVWLWTVDYSGTLTHNLNDNWSSSVSGGMQLTKRNQDTYGVSGSGFVANTLNLVSSAATRNASQGFSEQTSLGFYVQEQVGYKDRVFATAAVRVDDNSAFGRDFSLVVYPKASLSWVISEEDFFNVSFVDELKLRGAWGQAGNAPAPFSADRNYGTGRTVIGDVAVNVLETNDFGNPNLKAETGQELELGFESSLFGGKVGIDFTLYNKATKDALLSVNDPPSSGWTGSHLINVGEINNKGVELAINGTPVRNSFLEWEVIASISTTKNELVSFGKDAQGNPTLVESRFGAFASTQRHREGYPLGGYWATKYKRDANGLPIISGTTPLAEVEACLSWAEEFRDECQEEFIGTPFPTRQLGLTNTLRILNNIQIYTFLDYQGGHYQWCAICYTQTRTDLNSRERNDPRLDPTHPEYETWGKYQLGILRSTQTETYIYKADFIKLRELAATYTLPRQYTQRFGFSRAAVTLSGRNLWMATKYRDGRDPEVAFTGDAAFETSDYGSIPMQRRWTLAFNFNF
jgi:TonB-linked SusC/RagA family outer membrane protein